MKGMELPINVLIIVAVALIALLGVIALYFSGFNPFSTTMSVEAVKNEACRRLVQERRCLATPSQVIISDLNFVYGTTTVISLRDYCIAVFEPDLTDAQCKKMCGCP